MESQQSSPSADDAIRKWLAKTSFSAGPRIYEAASVPSEVMTDSTKEAQTTISVRDSDWGRAAEERGISLVETAPDGLVVKAKSIISTPRKDALDAKGLSNLETRLKKVKYRNETSFQGWVEPALFPVGAEDAPPAFSMLGRTEPWTDHIPIQCPIPKDSATASGLMQRLSLPLSQPQPDISAGYALKALNGDQRLTVKSWRVPGLKKGKKKKGEAHAELSEVDLSYLAPHPELLLPFLTVEIKSFSTGIIPEAERQNMGNGAIGMQGRVKLFEEIDKTFGPEDTLFFSVTINQVTATVFIHWAEEGQNDRTIYPMYQLEEFQLSTPEGKQGIRSVVRNIIDYYLNEDRLGEIRGYIDKLGRTIQAKQ